MLTQEQNEYVTRTQEKPFTEAPAEALSPKPQTRWLNGSRHKGAIGDTSTVEDGAALMSVADHQSVTHLGPTESPSLFRRLL